MQAEPLVTLVTPTHNRLAFLRETIASVTAQTFPDWEYIVVDDGSDDGTWDWLQAAGDPRIRPVRFERSKERAAARNAGLKAARGEYIYFLDDDDLLDPEALAVHLAALRSNPTTIASVGGYRIFDQKGGRQPIREIGRTQILDVWNVVLLGWVPVSGQWLFRTADVKQIGGWDGSWIPIEDHQLLLHLTGLGPVVVNARIVLNYRVHSGQWRPEDLDGRMTALREAYVAGLPEDRRAHAERLLAARKEYNSARLAYWDAHGRRALGGFIRALRLQPSLLRSPIGRKMILPLLAKSLAGGAGLKFGGRVRQLLRKVAGRQIESTVQVKETTHDEKD